MRMKVIFYAEPKDESQPLKSVPDDESMQAKWVSIQEFKDLCRKTTGARGPELIDYAEYLE